MVFGETIKALRKKHRYTQPQVAEKLNVSINTIGNWENANMVPGTEKLVKLAILYNTTLGELLDIKPQETLSLEHLNPEQLRIVKRILLYFSENEFKMPSKMTPSQKQLVLDLMSMFLDGRGKG